jgi:ATP-dependent RNA helicase DHX37/DHR1
MSSSPLSPGQTPVHPLKLIVMSATLRTEDFLENRRLFPVRPPLVSVPSRQFPVTVHFSRRTELHDYIGAAYKKVCQIHKNLPPGGVLVFLTGQREVEYLCQKLRKGLQSRKPTASTKQQESSRCRESKSTGSGVDGTGDAPWPLNDQENGALCCLEGADEGETDAAAAADEAMLLEALAEDRNAGGEGYPDDFELQEDDDDNVDEEEEEEEDDVVVLGGEGFTPEQIAEAEKLFDQRLAAAFASLNTATTAASSDTKGLKTKTDDEDGDNHTPPVHVLPLYAMLSPSQQARVFAPPPPGSRLIVVATNVAETSLTIPGIRYVVDAGRSKQRLIESAAGLARFEVRWISQASAEQRAGRAGRTGPGHCYRLFSSAVFNDTFPRHSPPEIANAALEGVALVLKSLGVDKVVNFPFPTPPEATALSAAEKCLVALAALDPSTGRLTAMGKDMATFPISPRHARMLLEVVRDYATSPGGNNGLNDAVSAVSNANAITSTEKRRKDAVSKQPSVTKAELLSYAVALAAALSVESPFINVEIAGFGGEDATETGRKSGRSEHDREKGESDGAEQGPASGKAAVAQRTTAMEAAAKEEQKRKRQEARQAHARLRVHDSDALSALCALCAFEAAGQSESFCRANHLHFRNLREASALRKQLARIVASQTATMPSLQTAAAAAAEKATLAATLQQTPASPPPLAALQALRKALTAGWADHVARRVRSLDYVMRQRPQSGEESQYTRTHKGRAVRYLSCAMDDEEVFLHPNSALYTAAPEFVVYSELVRTSKRPYMAGVTAVEASWLPRSAAAMCDFSEPLANPPPFYNPSVDAVMCWRDATFGRHCWPLPRTTGEHSNATERAAAFADAFLSGEVVKSASELKSMLAVQPLLATRPETRVQRRAADLIAVLVSNKVDSKRALAAKWRKDPGFLKREMLSWVQKGGAARFEAMWPKMVAEAFASPGRKSAVP